RGGQPVAGLALDGGCLRTVLRRTGTGTWRPRALVRAPSLAHGAIGAAGARLRRCRHAGGLLSASGRLRGVLSRSRRPEELRQQADARSDRLPARAAAHGPAVYAPPFAEGTAAGVAAGPGSNA